MTERDRSSGGGPLCGLTFTQASPLMQELNQRLTLFQVSSKEKTLKLMINEIQLTFVAQRYRSVVVRQRKSKWNRWVYGMQNKDGRHTVAIP